VPVLKGPRLGPQSSEIPSRYRYGHVVSVVSLFHPMFEKGDWR
jgi:hypothetical protein